MRPQPILPLLLAYALTTFPPVTAAPGQAAPPASAGLPALPTFDSIPPRLFQKMFRSDKLVGSPGLAWKKLKVITVAFHGGSVPLYRLIEQTAREWTALGGQLSFSFKDASGNYREWSHGDQSPAAQIRIEFEDTGYWSLLGVLATNVEPGEPTMNYGGFPLKLQKYFNGQNAAEWRTAYERVTILHEFGHALGLSHEHFNTPCQLDLKIDSVIASLTGPPAKWSVEQARFNIDARYYAEVLGKQAGKFETKLFKSATTDQKSVMLYLMDAAYYKSGDQSVCKPVGDSGRPWPTRLSDGDKSFYLGNYGVIKPPF